MTDTPEPDFTTLWQDQPEETKTMTLEIIHRRARKFEAWQAREIITLCACTGLIVIVAGFVIALFPDGLFRLGYALLMLAFMFILYYRYTYRTVDRVATSPSAACIDFYHRALTNRLHQLRWIWLWGWLPLAPGAVMILYSANGILARAHVAQWRLTLAGNVLFGVEVFLAVAIVPLVIKKQLRERKLKRELAALGG